MGCACFSIGGRAMKGEQKETAAHNVINILYECGYIDDKERRMFIYRLKAGERAVYEELRGYLLELSNEITK